MGPHDARSWPGIGLATRRVAGHRVGHPSRGQVSGTRDVPGTRLKRRADGAVVAAAPNRHFSMRGGRDVGTGRADGAIWAWRR